MAWLEPRAVEHQNVNYRLHDAVEAMIPLAFGTVFRNDDRVRQVLRERSGPLTERLEVVRGCGEWVLALELLREPGPELVAQASQGFTEGLRSHDLRHDLREAEAFLEACPAEEHEIYNPP